MRSVGSVFYVVIVSEMGGRRAKAFVLKLQGMSSRSEG
jgi:hypothetical protein